jgi:hypothetical protein
VFVDTDAFVASITDDPARGDGAPELLNEDQQQTVTVRGRLASCGSSNAAA